MAMASHWCRLAQPCVNAGALPKQAQAMAACFLSTGTLLAKVFGLLSNPQVAHERKSFNAMEVEVVCCH